MSAHAQAFPAAVPPAPLPDFGMDPPGLRDRDGLAAGFGGRKQIPGIWRRVLRPGSGKFPVWGGSTPWMQILPLEKAALSSSGSLLPPLQQIQSQIVQEDNHLDFKALETSIISRGELDPINLH